MYFSDINSLLFMDGHGAFVWASYGITALVVLILLLAPLRRRRRLMREIGGELRRSDAASAAGEGR